MTPAPPADRGLPVLFWVAAAGGVLGGSLRLLVETFAPVHAGTFPWSTLAINVVGSALLALLPALSSVRRHPLLPVFLGTGVLGGFTTMSTASAEAFALFRDGSAALGSSYVIGTVGCAALAVLLVDRLSTPGDRVEFEIEEGDE